MLGCSRAGKHVFYGPLCLSFAAQALGCSSFPPGSVHLFFLHLEMGSSLALVTCTCTPSPSTQTHFLMGWQQEMIKQTVVMFRAAGHMEALRRLFSICSLERIIFFFSSGIIPYSMSPEEKPKANHHKPPHLQRGRTAPLQSLPTVLICCPRIDLDLIQEKLSVVMLILLRESPTPTHGVWSYPLAFIRIIKLHKNTEVQPQNIPG